jgi:hypothetical protein
MKAGGKQSLLFCVDVELGLSEITERQREFRD